MHIVIVVRRNAGIMLASAIAILFASNIASNAHAAQIDAALVPEFGQTLVVRRCKVVQLVENQARKLPEEM